MLYIKSFLEDSKTISVHFVMMKLWFRKCEVGIRCSKYKLCDHTKERRAKKGKALTKLYSAYARLIFL